MKILKKQIIPIFIFFFNSSCKNIIHDERKDQKGHAFDTSAFFFGQMDTLEIDVYAEPGAEPFDIGSKGRSEYQGFTLLKANIDKLFENRTILPTVVVPEPGEYLSLPDQSRSAWSSDDMRALEASYRQRYSRETTGNFFIAFVNGYLESDGQQEKGVIGVSLGGTSIIFMFKDVIASTGQSPNGLVPKFVEQSTLIHEMGHALGLVNNGVSLASQHHDAANGAHCLNQDCVMYWLNEGKDAAVSFIRKFLDSGRTDVNLFGNSCLEDTRLYIP